MQRDHDGDSDLRAQILLVEDNPDDADLTLRALRKRRVADRIAWVKDGAEALDFLFAQGVHSGRASAPPPALVLLDLKLPKVGGIEVLRRMRADPRLRMVPVVILTSSAHDHDVVGAYLEGVNSYVTKPIEFAKFQAAVEEVGIYWMQRNRSPEPPAVIRGV